MASVTIENINGEMFTVVWHRELKPTWKTEWYRMNDSYALMHVKNTAYHIATALPALPRKPKPENAALLYRYASEGLMPKYAVSDRENECCIYGIHSFSGMWSGKITHAIDAKTGQRVEIAIKEKTNANT